MISQVSGRSLTLLARTHGGLMDMASTSEDQHRGHLRIVRLLVALALVTTALGLTSAAALDQPLTGRKLVLRSTPRLVLTSKDGDIDITGSDPPCSGADSVLVMDDGVTAATFLLPCENWRASSTGTLFKYRNPYAPLGASAVQSIKIKGGHLKIVSRGMAGLPVPSGDAVINVMLSLDGITHRYCMSFSGTGDGSRFVAVDPLAASCPNSTPCAATTGGFCWYLGVTKASCDAVCAINGRTYDTATETYAGSSGSAANCTAVLDALGTSAGPVTDEAGCFDGAGCLYAAPLGRFRCTSPSTNATAASTIQRVCACQ